MNSTIKNIIIFVAIAAALVLAYIFFFHKSAPVANLTSSSTTAVPVAGVSASTQPSAIGSDFLSILLNVKSIKLDDSIFLDPAFLSLHDSSILLISDGTEGRPNPFAPIGADISTSSTSNSTLTNLIPISNTVPPASSTPTVPASGTTVNSLNSLLPPNTTVPKTTP